MSSILQSLLNFINLQSLHQFLIAACLKALQTVFQLKASSSARSAHLQRVTVYSVYNLVQYIDIPIWCAC